MDFTRALTYPFDDPDWMTKLGIGFGIAILLFIPIIGSIPAGILFAGWSLEIAKRVRNGDPMPLPSWDFGTLFGKGLNVFIAYIVYQIPTLILACLIFLPSILGGAAAGSSNDSGTASALGSMGGFASLCCSCVLILYLIASLVVLFGGYVRYLETEQLNTFFQFGDNIAIIRNNAGDFGMAVLYIIGGAFVIGLLGIIPLIGTLAAVPLQQAYFGHLLGQLATKLHAGAAAAPAV